MELNFDGQIDIAKGVSRHNDGKKWKNVNVAWSSIVQKLSVTHRTAETVKEYATAKKDRQDAIKDVGGFVGGYLMNGSRSKTTVAHRQLVCLDLDFCNYGFWDDFTMAYDCGAVLYSTHKHTPDNPRYRLIIPLDREVPPDEYEAIGRRIAGFLNIELFDPTTFQPSRLMYWPSTSKDGEYVFKVQDGNWLNADSVLAGYRDWTDTGAWPRSIRDNESILRGIKKQGDPLEKTGIVGAFCRTFSIEEAIAKFMPETYVPCDMEGRFSYTGGSTSGGLVVYEDKYAYSHHATDPAGGKLSNAFDLVRLHKFGLKDEDSKENTPANKLPSFLAMVEFARTVPEVKRLNAREKLESVAGDFEGMEASGNGEQLEANTDWMETMEANDKLDFVSSRANFQTILLNDPNLKGKFAFDEFSYRKIVIGDLPWRKVTRKTNWLTDEDECELRIYLSKPPYSLSHNGNLKDVFDAEIVKNTVHPVKKYLEAHLWDGVERMETLFIDYQGAEDSLYTRQVSRKMLIAAVARLYEPGIKFEYIFTLTGDEGRQKSTIFRKLGGEWFSDSFSFKLLDKGNAAAEQLQGYWIVEIAELSGMRNAEIEAIKHFVAKEFDIFRPAYGENTAKFYRQSVFAGTTNTFGFLRGDGGNRRFWPVTIDVQKPTKIPSVHLNEHEVAQIWAEALEAYQKGEKLYLDEAVEHIARAKQKEHSEQDDRGELIRKYLDMLLPENWEEMGTYQRINYINGDDEVRAEGVKKRHKVCAAEIWAELFRGQVKDMNTVNTKPIHTILKKLDGWKPANGLHFGIYGKSRGYVRDKNEVDELIENCFG